MLFLTYTNPSSKLQNSEKCTAALQGSPYQTLSVPGATWNGVGLTDMALPAKGPYNAMATAQNGHVSCITM